MRAGQGSPGGAAPAVIGSGKAAGDENFPVGSWLLPARLRPHVHAFYAFARAADDVADSPDLGPEDKVARLERFAAILTGAADADPFYGSAARLRVSLAETGVTPRHALDLLAAFTQDATKRRYRDWPDLMGYCALSASPVGRYLLDLHGEDPRCYAASDPLCDALQVLNHLQDCRDDYRRLDRVYLPLAWFEAEGGRIEELDGPRASPAVRRMLDRTLDATEDLLRRARDLPLRLRSARLATESAVILRLAGRLTAELRRRDPLAGRVEVGRFGWLLAGIEGCVGATRRLANSRERHNH